MDAVDPNNAAQYSYQRMVEQAFIDGVADQIVAGIVEVLFDRQSDLDSVKYDGQMTLW
jgi:hypothetical protein